MACGRRLVDRRVGLFTAPLVWRKVLKGNRILPTGAIAALLIARPTRRRPRRLIETGLVYGVLPLRHACRSRVWRGSEVESGRLCYAPLCEPALTQQLGVAATSQLELPREFAAKIGNIIREEAARLTESGGWPARFLSPDRWDPSSA